MLEGIWRSRESLITFGDLDFIKIIIKNRNSKQITDADTQISDALWRCRYFVIEASIRRRKCATLQVPMEICTPEWNRPLKCRPLIIWVEKVG